jgi:antitoxin PrlF
MRTSAAIGSLARPPPLVLLSSLTAMRVTQKGQVTIPLDVRRALGIQPGTNVEFMLDAGGARLIVDQERAADEIARMRGAGDVELTTDEILALTRR